MAEAVLRERAAAVPMHAYEGAGGIRVLVRQAVKDLGYLSSMAYFLFILLPLDLLKEMLAVTNDTYMQS